MGPNRLISGSGVGGSWVGGGLWLVVLWCVWVGYRGVWCGEGVCMCVGGRRAPHGGVSMCVRDHEENDAIFPPPIRSGPPLSCRAHWASLQLATPPPHPRHCTMQLVRGHTRPCSHPPPSLWWLSGCRVAGVRGGQQGLAKYDYRPCTHWLPQTT
ncbi:hypothetical protein E2C01_063616 [Portunus trituberculatus]|uniref:Uncharacterized protein n=1 Tax=Portunus trituberculatus TaxID=210409 RepID=A0A5B7HGU6_PORTR|nr:hypothetical protein [Portunus trituberculatus]